jgi:hypothetical protein
LQHRVRGHCHTLLVSGKRRRNPTCRHRSSTNVIAASLVFLTVVEEFVRVFVVLSLVYAYSLSCPSLTIRHAKKSVANLARKDYTFIVVRMFVAASPITLGEGE